MSYVNIFSALRTKLESADLGFLILDENKSQNTKNIDTYLADFILPVTTESMMKEAEGSREENGIYQISIFTRADIGRGKIFGIADSIKNVFKYDDEYVFSGTTVQVQESTANQGRNDNGRFVVDVSINWFSYIQR